VSPCYEEDAVCALLGYQRACRTALALPGNGNALLTQACAKIGLVLAKLNLLSSGTQLLVGNNLFRPSGEGLELEYALLH
jgi:hypothetical protein